MFDGLIDGRFAHKPEPNEVAVILKNAAKLVRRGHTQRVFARTSNGRVVSTFDADAVKFCAAGAITRAAYDYGFSRDQSCLLAARYYRLQGVNDNMKGFFKGSRMAAIIEKATPTY